MWSIFKGIVFGLSFLFLLLLIISYEGAYISQTPSHEDVIVPITIPAAEETVEEKLPLAPLPTTSNESSSSSPEIPGAFAIQTAKNATVNILCILERTDRVSTLSGSGVFIDPRGVILTNAHVAQYFLFTKDPDPFEEVRCSIRKGSPAKTLYAADILYLSPTWVTNNASSIADETPRGTGENDFAFLLVRKPSSSNTASFPHTTPDIDDSDLDVGVPVVVTSYPAAFLDDARDIVNTLFLFATVADITDLFTFSETVLDLVSLQGSFLAQQGSSGGAVVGSDAFLKGIVTLSSADESFSKRSLRAITLSHINRSLKEETGDDLHALLDGSLTEKVDSFAHTLAPTLRTTLEENLQ